MDFLHPVEAVIPGVQGQVLAALAESDKEMNLRTVARLADVSPTQASRVLPTLVELGIVERREVPPSSLFMLHRDHIVAPLLTQLARSHDAAVTRMRDAARDMPTQPASLVVFGSFARREADRYSDIDTLFVRPPNVNEDDDAWTSGMDFWAERVRSFTGNRVEIMETPWDTAISRIGSRRPVWQDIARDGIVIHGASIEELRSSRRG